MSSAIRDLIEHRDLVFDLDDYLRGRNAHAAWYQLADAHGAQEIWPSLEQQKGYLGWRAHVQSTLADVGRSWAMVFSRWRRRRLPIGTH